jgi:endonuclease III
MRQGKKRGKRARNEDTPKDDAKSPAPPAFLLNRTSSHFIRSPSSPVGSISCLGSLVEVLSGYMKCFCFKCSTNRKSQSFAEAKTAILGHFQTCPHFNRDFKKHTKEGHYRAKEFEAIILLSVSHLCHDNCFLRAFAPARKWHELRTSICHYGNISPDQVLKDWICFLEKDTAGSAEIGLKPRVSFVAPNGRVMDSGDRVLQALGFIDCSARRINVKGSSAERKEKSHPPLRILQFKDRSIVESEIIGSIPMHGIQCKLETAPKTCARRTLYGASDQVSSDVVPSRDISSTLNISPFGLIEELFQRDPWRLLISTILLNRTCREQVDFVMFKLLEKYGNATAMEKADPNIISNIIRPIGIRYRRAETLIRFSREYNALIGAGAGADSKKCTAGCDQFFLSYDEIMNLYGCGEYAAHAYQIFIRKKYDNISVSDHALQYYVDYKRGTPVKSELTSKITVN